MKAGNIFRITVLFFLLIQPLALNAEEEPGLRVFAEINPEMPVTGRPFIYTLFIDYPVPEDVIVTAPSFAGFLSLDRIVKTPRVTETQTQTVVEYRFFPVNSGRFVLESFTVTCPAGIGESGSFVLDIRAESEGPRLFAPRILWEGAPRQMAAGERVTFALRVNGWNSQQPPPEFFMPPVPQGVILALSPLTAQERADGIALKLTLIPLSAGDFRLNARNVQHENVRFSIPALYIQITGPSAGQTQTGAQDIASVNDNAVNVQASFPDFILTAPEKSGIRENHRLQCEKIYNTAKDLWDSGLFARSLAELRRNERDHPAGALLEPIRRQAEESLGFFNTESENRQRRKLLPALLSFALFLVIIVPFVCFILVKGRNSLRGKATLLCAVVFSVVSAFCFYRFADSNFVFSGKGNRFGVTRETPVRRTADFDGEELFSFREGQPVVILLSSDSWVYVRANDAAGFSGWIPAEKTEFY